MKKLGEKLKEAWYGALPVLILVVVPTATVVTLWLIFNWNDLPKILSRIIDIGNGSLLYGIGLLLLALIGLINAFAAYMMWFRAFAAWLDRKSKSRFWFYFAIIVVTFGWYALFRLIKLL